MEFLQYANRRGVAIFYISNREAHEELEPTYENLRALGFPIHRDHMLFRSGPSGKQARRDSG